MANPLAPADAEYDRRMDRRNAFLSSLPQDELADRSFGSYFSTMDVVWKVESRTIQDDWFEPIVRTAEQGNRLYRATTLPDNFSHPMSQSESSSLTDTTQTNSRFDMFDNPTSEKAHLFSNAPVCYKGYGFLAQAATGKNVDTPLDRLKLLSGIKKAGGARRPRGCGLKHHKFNKMYLFLQKEYWDCDPPRLIVVPILDLSELLNWNGEDEYDVMAITVGANHGRVCSQRVLQAAPSTCTEQDVEMATGLVECFVKAIACSVRNHPVDESFDPQQLDWEKTPITPLKKWAMLKKELQATEAKVRFPQLRNDIDWTSVKVAKATASLDNSLPDPYNLAIKAAINFSAIVGAKLMPACPVPDSDGTSSSDEEMNSTQGNDESQWPESARREDFSSLLRSFGHPADPVSG